MMPDDQGMLETRAVRMRCERGGEEGESDVVDIPFSRSYAWVASVRSVIDERGCGETLRGIEMAKMHSRREDISKLQLMLSFVPPPQLGFILSFPVALDRLCHIPRRTRAAVRGARMRLGGKTSFRTSALLLPS